MRRQRPQRSNPKCSFTFATIRGSVSLSGGSMSTVRSMRLGRGTVMTVLSIIPGVGGALVWVPAAIILMTTGEVWRGIALALFCALARRADHRSEVGPREAVHVFLERHDRQSSSSCSLSGEYLLATPPLSPGTQPHPDRASVLAGVGEVGAGVATRVKKPRAPIGSSTMTPMSARLGVAVARTKPRTSRTTHHVARDPE
jgi:hypothetical protein